MLTSIHFENFKSYESAKLPLAQLTVLLGANASGKSNALEALQLLTWLAEGRRLDTLLVALQQHEIAVRGAPAEMTRISAPVRLGCTMLDGEGRRLELTVALQVSDEGMRIIGESLSRQGETVPLYEMSEPASAYSNDVQVSYNNFARGGTKPKIPAIDQQAVFTQLTTPARFDAGHGRSQREIPEAASVVQRTLEGVLFLDPTPSRMRDYSFKVDHRKLRGDGSNVSSVLAHLCQEPPRKNEALAFVRSLPEQDIADVSFIDGPRGEVMVELTESFGGQSRSMSARLLSDGTLRVLAIAAALLSVPAGTLVVIEEIDNGVHPPRAQALLDNITSVARKRNLRVLLTTHNTALLDAVPTAAIGDVVACYRDPLVGSSQLVRLADMERYPELVAQGPLGHIVTKGILDRVLKSSPNRQQTLDRLLLTIGKSA